MDNKTDKKTEGWEIISVYSKDQAVEDGYQIKLGEIAKEAGFNCPVYLTSEVNHLCTVPAGLEGLQDYEGRLWDVLMMARLEIRRMIKRDEYTGNFTVYFQQTKECGEDVKLLIAFDPLEGFTIMFPNQY